MSDVTCVRCGKTGHAIHGPTLPGELGKRILDTICEECWTLWKREQTKVINHFHLDLRDPKARQQLTQQTETFLFGAAKKAEAVSFQVNGEPVSLVFASHKTLLEVLREDLNLTGTKHGCELGECGTCTVLVEGQPVLSCLVLGLACEGLSVDTVEGMAKGPELHPLQAAFADLGAAQCGYCTPGILMAAEALLREKPKPKRDEIKDALSGNLCRCTGYLKIYEAVELAAEKMGGQGGRGGR